MEMNGNRVRERRFPAMFQTAVPSGRCCRERNAPSEQKIQDCVWYTLDEDGERAVFDLDEPIMENLEVNVDKNLQKPLNFTADVL